MIPYYKEILGFDEGSNTQEPFALGYGAFCLCFLYDCRCKFIFYSISAKQGVLCNDSIVYPRRDDSEHDSSATSQSSETLDNTEQEQISFYR